MLLISSPALQNECRLSLLPNYNGHMIAIPIYRYYTLSFLKFGTTLGVGGGKGGVGGGKGGVGGGKGGEGGEGRG